jgi:hypothetical protein
VVRLLDGQALSQESASIDHVLTTWTVCSIPDVDRALGAIRRVLRPGGFGARPLTRAQGRGLAGRCEESWGAKLGGSPRTPERLARLARLARMRWKIELDYKQLKGELGLDHYEGRSWLGWYHHTALVTAAHGFLTLERQHPNHPRPA